MKIKHAEFAPLRIHYDYEALTIISQTPNLREEIKIKFNRTHIINPSGIPAYNRANDIQATYEFVAVLAKNKHVKRIKNITGDEEL